MPREKKGYTVKIMKCLVFSDSHGSDSLIKEALAMHSDAEAVFFLGDGLREVDILSEEYPEKFWIAVRGNCDFYSFFKGAPAEKLETVSLGGYKIVLTHGDLYGVKYGSAGLIKLARDTSADIVLFGHTHAPFEKYISEYEKPFYLFNPGSISLSSGSYGIMTLAKIPFFSHGQII